MPNLAGNCPIGFRGAEGPDALQVRIKTLIGVSPHFSRPREKCAQSADPAAAGSGLTAKAFAPAGRFPSGLRRVDFPQIQKFVRSPG
jgi:hypothetical protein